MRSDLSLERRRQQVLPGVLLHVIEPAHPVDVPAHTRVLLELAIDEMADGAVLLLEDIEHLGLVERARVERLAARGRIERRPIERHLPLLPLLLDVADDGIEFDQVGVGVVETLG